PVRGELLEVGAHGGDARLLLELALRRVEQVLVFLHEATGQRPLPGERLDAAAHREPLQPRAAPGEHDDADGDGGGQAECSHAATLIVTLTTTSFSVIVKLTKRKESHHGEHPQVPVAPSPATEPGDARPPPHARSGGPRRRRPGVLVPAAHG